MAKIKLEHSRERVFLFFIPGQKISALRYLELIGSLPTSSFFYTISIFERAKRTLHFLLVHCPDQRIENRSLCNVPYR